MTSLDRFRSLEQALQGRRLPAVVVDLEAYDRNVAAAAGVVIARGERQTLRLATKSVRVPELIRRALAYGAPYRGLMVYAAEEAVFLAEQGFDDFLIAYPTAQKSDVLAAAELHRAGRKVRLMVDSIDHVRMISGWIGRLERPLELVIDLDMSLRILGGLLHLGVRRSPVRTPAGAVELYEAAAGFSNISVVGLMGYEAQVAGLGDRNPFKRLMNPLFGIVRSLSARSVARLREEVAEAIENRGFALEIFNGGGSGSLNWTVREPWLTEVTAGSAFVCSHLFDYYSNIRYEPAAYFVLKATRSSDPGYVTCAGGGYIASGEPGWDKVPVPVYPEGLRLVKEEGCGEVQTPLRLPAGSDLEPGGRVFFRHAKAGELAERFNEYLLVSGGRVVSEARTYRGYGRSFL